MFNVKFIHTWVYHLASSTAFYRSINSGILADGVYYIHRFYFQTLSDYKRGPTPLILWRVLNGERTSFRPLYESCYVRRSSGELVTVWYSKTKIWSRPSFVGKDGSVKSDDKKQNSAQVNCCLKTFFLQILQCKVDSCNFKIRILKNRLSPFAQRGIKANQLIN